ncbi:MAG: transposase [Planctomycetota bacterium]
MQLPGVVREIVLEGLEEMARLSRQIEHWNARLAQIAKELPEVEEIRRQLPGFGPLLAAVVVGELGELSRLATPRPCRYAGLVPTRRGTGGDPRHGQISPGEVPTCGGRSSRPRPPPYASRRGRARPSPPGYAPTSVTWEARRRA